MYNICIKSSQLRDIFDMPTSNKKDTVASVKVVLNSFLKFKEKDAEIRQKARDIFAKAKNRINEKKIKDVKERINKA